ncbi:MAG: methyltransferase domain-containing protein [Chitinophagaceae bacterium]|nr:methyltransferase domain-containing protein [Chitinophagaceae bacterium]
MSNINDTYFDGHYKDIWRTMIPAELTVKEVDFMLSYFSLGPGSKVLDLMCGYGRHAIALAQKGIAVTAVDNLDEYIREIKEVVIKESLPVEVVQQDAIRFTSTVQYDLALCMGNSLNFFNAEDASLFLHNTCSMLKPGGCLLINSWSLTEIAVKSFTPRSWSEIGNLKFLSACEYLFHPTRMEFTSTILSPDGKTEVKNGIDYIYSVSEMETMLNKAGFKMKEIYSIPGRKKFTLGEPRAYIVAEKLS